MLKYLLVALLFLVASVNTADAARVRRLNTPNPLTAVTSTNKVNLHWTDVANEYNYIIERRVKGTASFTQIGIVGSNVVQFVDTLSTIGDYEYRVRASRNSLYSSYTNIVAVTYCG